MNITLLREWRAAVIEIYTVAQVTADRLGPTCAATRRNSLRAKVSLQGANPERIVWGKRMQLFTYSKGLSMPNNLRYLQITNPLEK